MLSTSAKFALNKKTLEKKPFPLTGMKHSLKNLFPLAGKTVFIVRNWKIEENYFTPNFNNVPPA